MPTTALISGGLAAVGGIGSALIGSNAAQNASAQQVAEQQQALAVQQQMFSTAQKALNPFINAGTNVLPTLTGLVTPGPNQNALLSQTPGFQFTNQYGLMGATNALASRGLGASAGPVATAAANYSSGLASNTWQSVVQALQGVAGLGGNAANALATSALNSGNSQASTLTNTGNALASGTLGSASALAGGLTGGGNALSSSLLLGALGQRLLPQQAPTGIYASPASVLAPQQTGDLGAIY